MRVKMSKPTPPAPTASAIGPCPTVIKIVGRPGTGSLPSTIAPPNHPLFPHLDTYQHTDILHNFSLIPICSKKGYPLEARITLSYVISRASL